VLCDVLNNASLCYSLKTFDFITISIIISSKQPNLKNSMLPNPTHNRKPIHPRLQNEFQFKGIYTRINDIIPNGRFSKVCHEFHVVLDIIFWIGLFVLNHEKQRECA
jgi:hypothetical protein